MWHEARVPGGIGKYHDNMQWIQSALRPEFEYTAGAAAWANLIGAMVSLPFFHFFLFLIVPHLFELSSLSIFSSFLVIPYLFSQPFPVFLIYDCISFPLFFFFCLFILSLIFLPPFIDAFFLFYLTFSFVSLIISFSYVIICSFITCVSPPLFHLLITNLQYFWWIECVQRVRWNGLMKLRRTVDKWRTLCLLSREKWLHHRTGEDQFSVKLHLSDRAVPIERPHKTVPSLQYTVKQPALHDFHLTSTHCGKQEVCLLRSLYICTYEFVLPCVCRFMSPTGNSPFKIQAEVSCSWKFVHVQVVRLLTPPPRQRVLQVKVCTYQGSLTSSRTFEARHFLPHSLSYCVA